MGKIQHVNESSTIDQSSILKSISSLTLSPLRETSGNIFNGQISHLLGTKRGAAPIFWGKKIMTKLHPKGYS